MQQLALEQRRLLGPRAPWHVGDVAWGLRQHEGREHEWKIRLWVEDERVVAWSWLKQDGRELARARRPSGAPASPRRNPRRAGGAASRRLRGRRRARGRARAARLHAAGRRDALPRARPRRATRCRRRCRTASATGPSAPTTCPSASRSTATSGRPHASPSELRAGPGPVAVPRVARLRRRGAGRPLRRVLPLLARRRERRWRVRAGRRPPGLPPPRTRRRRLHVRAAAPARGRRAAGDRRLRRPHRRARFTSRSASASTPRLSSTPA